MPAYWTWIFPAVLAWSALAPYDYATWFLDMLPAGAAFLALLATRHGFPLTPLSYALLWVLCLLILVGAHYSFGKVPLFEWLKPWLGGERNQFDKLAHLFQGFAPAIVLRELLIRWEVVARRRGLAWLVPALCLALSAAYELVEWIAALILRERAEDFLAIQGDPWDAQSDMACALAGAIAATALLGRWHDRQLARLSP